MSFKSFKDILKLVLIALLYGGILYVFYVLAPQWTLFILGIEMFALLVQALYYMSKV